MLLYIYYYISYIYTYIYIYIILLIYIYILHIIPLTKTSGNKQVSLNKDINHVRPILSVMSSTPPAIKKDVATLKDVNIQAGLVPACLIVDPIDITE